MKPLSRMTFAAALALPRLKRSALFDAAWYRATYPDVAAAKGWRGDPAWHYLRHGAAEGRDPGPDFSTSGYLAQSGPVHGNPLLHYLDHGRAAGLAPCPSFDGQLPPLPASTPAILFFGHQAQAQLFGAERSLLTLLDRAAGAGLRVELVLPHCLNPAYLEQARARSHRVHLLPYGWRRNGFAPHPATLAAMVALIRASGAVEVHQNTIVLDAPLIAARQAGVASVVHLRELPAEDAGICAALGIGPDDLRRALIAGADRFVANSTAVADWIDPQREMPGRVLILPNRVDPALSALPFAPGNPVRVGLISSNTCKKGIGDVVAVARAFLANPALVPVEFLLIGPDSADLRALHPLPAGLRQTGYAPSPAEAMAQVDVVLSLSHFAESFGRTVLEALEAGRPVICYDRGTPPKLLRDDAETVLAGAVVPADDPAAVADALRDLLASPDRLADAAQAARARAGVLRNRDTLPDHALFVRAFAAGGSPSDP